MYIRLYMHREKPLLDALAKGKGGGLESYVRIKRQAQVPVTLNYLKISTNLSLVYSSRPRTHAGIVSQSSIFLSALWSQRV